MEKSNKKSSSSSKLKHRFTRMLLCTTTELPSSTCPQHLESQLDRHFQRRCKLDHPWPLLSDGCSLPRGCAAPVIQVSISCGARRSIDASEPLLPLLLKKKEMNKKSKIDLERSMSNRRRILEAKKSLFDVCDFTSSSSEDRLDLFSSDDEVENDKETLSLLSSKSFSSDIYCRTRKKENSNNSARSRSMKRTQRPKRQAAKHPVGLRPLISEKEEKAKQDAGGFAMVKRSTDPYTDFRCSMVETIVERGMSSARELEHLLDAYLALNLPRHHEVILEAFVDICEAMFGK